MTISSPTPKWKSWPSQWRGGTLDLYGELSDEHIDDGVARARDLVAAAELYGELWGHFCHVERIVDAARSESSRPDWRGDAHELLDQLARGAAI